MLKPPVQFFFDFSSPYSCVASEWIEAVAVRHGRRVQWHAGLLGATFQAAELKSPVAYPIKRDYTLRDFDRSARFANLPYRQPETFPIARQNAARVFWWLHDQDPARATAWAHAWLRAYVTCGVVLSDVDVLKALLADSGIDAGAAVLGVERGLPDGVTPFWGNDRQAQIERWLSSGPFKGMA